MTVADTAELSEAIEVLSEATGLALEKKSADDFEAVSRRLGRIDVMVRELQQAMWADEAQDTIRRLKSGQALTETNRQTIRTFLISDAEHYLAVENNFDDWTAELSRLLADIARRAAEVDRDTIGELRGVLKDAIRLLPDIQNYLAERQRIERFDLVTATLDDTSRDLLVRLLKDQLNRPNR